MGERYDLVFDKTKTRITPRTLPAKKTRQVPVLMYLSGAGDVGLTFAIPLLLALYVGTKIDVHFGSKPLATLVLLVLGLVVSVVSVGKKIQQLIRT